VKNARGMDLSLTMRTDKTIDKTKFVYDLNIFQMEQLDADGEYRHFGPWYIHIYEYTGATTEEVSEPIELTPEEHASLISNDSYFEDEVDVWYGLEGFVFEKWDQLSDRLKYAFECLPKYREEVLF
jgi:hypothetical protein